MSEQLSSPSMVRAEKQCLHGVGPALGHLPPRMEKFSTEFNEKSKNGPKQFDQQD